MKTIYKYEVNESINIISMPIGAQILGVSNQDGNRVFWALIETNNPKEDRFFNVYGTGWDMSSSHDETYIGTVFTGPFVWHIFRKNKKEDVCW